MKFLIRLFTGLFLLTAIGTLHAADLTQTQVSQLYVSIFGRASEGEGNAYWRANQEDMTLAANAMLATEAAQSYFGATLSDNQKFIEFIYENTLGKTYSEDSEGVNYWVSELVNGKSKGEVVSTLINAVMDTAYQGLPAQDRFINKVSVCNYTADKISKVPDVNDLSAFKGYIDTVTEDDATVVTARAKVDAGLTASSDLVVSTPADEKMDSAKLDQMYLYIAGNTKFELLDAVLILRNGNIVSEKYYNGHDQNYKSPVFSVTKAITSLLVGVAVDNNLISEIDYILPYFPNKTVGNPDSRKNLIKLENLLTMQAGFTWDDISGAGNLKTASLMGQDTVEYMLGLTMAGTPGDVYEYNTGLGTLVDGVIYDVSKMHLDEFSDKWLFGPLSITDYTWEKDKFNTCLGGMGLHMTARDMAKIGKMALDDGEWNGSSIVSAGWMKKSTAVSVPSANMGYSWRVSDTDTRFYIPGAGGQLIDIRPDQKLVIIFKVATDLYGQSTDTMPQDLDALVLDYIVPACN